MATLPVPDGSPEQPLRVPKVRSARISERPRRHFEMRESNFGDQVNHEIEEWLHEQIRVAKEQLRQLFENKVPHWRRLAEGRPKEENKSWPFPNCSNLVHQLVGQEIDDFCARVLGLVYATSPLQYFRYFVESKEQDQSHRNAEKARILEQFYDIVGYETNELDLYQRDSIWLADSARLGVAWVKAVPEHKQEVVVVGYDSQSKKTKGEEKTLYEGPKVINLRFEDLLFDPNASSPETSPFLAHKCSLKRKEIEERVALGFYTPEAWASIQDRPDRSGPSEAKKRENRRKGIQDQSDTSILAEWDIYECWFPWFMGGRKYRLIWWYHYESRTVMNRVFNFMPDNRLAFVRTKLNSGEPGMLGQGYAQMLEPYQEEISTVKNQRIDATTFGILGINRISPANKNIDKYFQLYPGAAAPFAKDEFEHISIGEPSMVSLSIENEQMMLQQAHDRSGVGPAVAGSGSGTVQQKGKGMMMYGSMGTLAVLQDNNTRINYRSSDFRHSRVALASLLVSMYGAFGTGGRGELFGIDDALLAEALDDFLEHRVRIPIRAATASANKEVEKQNAILLSQHLMMYHTNVIKMLQAMEQGTIPPNVKKFFAGAIKGLVSMERRLLRDFGFDQPEEFAPEPDMEDASAQAQQQQPSPAARLLQMARSRGAQGPGVGVGQQPQLGTASGGAPQPAGGIPGTPETQG
jgi:hypothetical protein